MVVTATTVVFTAFLAAIVAGENCELNLQTQTNSKKEPLILDVSKTRDGRPSPHLVYPSVIKVDDKTYQGVIRVSDGKELMVACMGEDNQLEISQTETDYVKCSNGQLTIQGQPADEDTLSCHKDVSRSWIEKTEEICGKGNSKGTKLELGFKLNDDEQNTLFPLVDVCHNIQKMESYYAHHELHGESLKGAVQSKLRRPFSEGPKKLHLFSGINADKAYSKSSQTIAIDAILGKGEGKRYVNETVFLARGHLAPDADFIFNTGQQMTYYFINVAPQWQPFNAGNWLQVESTVRSLAVKVQASLKVWTGTYGVLKLENKRGEEKEIYLDPKEARKPKPQRKNSKPKPNEEPEDVDQGNYLPVPEVYWKLVQHGESCTVAVGHNNVYLKTEPTPICNAIDVRGWPELKVLSKGYTYYCEYESFKKTVYYVPDIECTSPLEFPQ
ncbi:uncharacterized protein LOC128983249 [Macrosteles quadrilineatus]|uniref:uncharacterized protein LOC128983249 n=1 Tax=Macrosteles quadrilineatus TaxID=74068 RepID=UPI0023E290CE|nr:uncharacterized protein LOC128983249 [Macrosteles quadrilineatus]